MFLLRVEVVAGCWGLFNLPPLSLPVVGWCGGHLSSPRGLWAWRRPACAHAAWDAPPHTGSHWSVHHRCQSPTGKQTKKKLWADGLKNTVHLIRVLMSVTNIILNCTILTTHASSWINYFTALKTFISISFKKLSFLRLSHCLVWKVMYISK